MFSGQDASAAFRTDLHVCGACDRDFVVPVRVLGLVGDDRCAVELGCMNCGAAAVGVHDDRSLTELDHRMDAAQDLMRDTLALLEVADELERIDRFAGALRAGHILPEDF